MPYGGFTLIKKPDLQGEAAMQIRTRLHRAGPGCNHGFFQSDVFLDLQY